MQNVPITGFLYHSDNGDSSHSHNLYITTWDGRPVHIHQFEGVTSFDDGHNHLYAGNTEPAPSGVKHTHHYFTFTTIDDGHKHFIQGITGLDIPLIGGGHYHEFSGVTTVNGINPHRHQYGGMTHI